MATRNRWLHWLLTHERIGYLGGTTTPRDARRVFTRWRRGASILIGPHLRAFERALSDYYEGAEAICFGGARMACYAILKALGLSAGDEVILPGYNCVVVPNAILRLGVRPVYVDVSLRDCNAIPELVERALTPRTKAIIVQHTFGIAADMDAFLTIGRRYGLPIIEDGAHAIGARCDGRLLGLFGLAAFFSTQETKMMDTCNGGFVVTTDRQLAAAVRHVQEEAAHLPEQEARACVLRWCYNAAVASQPRLNARLLPLTLLALRVPVPVLTRLLTVGMQRYESELASEFYEPYPLRLPDLLAYGGLLQLQRIEEDVAHRRALAAFLETHLPALGARILDYDHKRVQPSWVRFPFIVPSRAPWLEATRRSALTAGFWLSDPCHPEGTDWRRVQYCAGSCPNAEYLSQHILNVPVDRRVRLRHLRQWLELCRAALCTTAAHSCSAGDGDWSTQDSGTNGLLEPPRA